MEQNKRIKFELGQKAFLHKLVAWEELLNHDFQTEQDFKSGVWEAVDSIWNEKSIKSLSDLQLKILFETIANRDPIEFLSQVSALLSIFETWYPNQKQLILLLIETKTITCSSQLQYFIDKEFIATKNKEKILLPHNLEDFSFSQYSDEKEANKKVQKILSNYKEITDDQAYLLITSIFGLKYVNRSLRKQLASLIKTSPRYSESNIEFLPSYEETALKAL